MFDAATDEQGVAPSLEVLETAVPETECGADEPGVRSCYDARMTPLVSIAIDEYARTHTSDRPSLLDELRDVTHATMENPQMQVGPVEGTLLKFLVAVSGARCVLEIGTFTGYSALCMAEGLAEGGELFTCDLDEKALAVARGFFARSPHGSKIRVLEGRALDRIAALQASPPFDLVFIDADKEAYVDYYELCVPRLRPGGLLVADNALWSGSVLDPQTPSARAIAAFNDRVQQDDRTENVMLTVRDGMLVARKR